MEFMIKSRFFRFSFFHIDNVRAFVEIMIRLIRSMQCSNNKDNQKLSMKILYLQAQGDL